MIWTKEPYGKNVTFVMFTIFGYHMGLPAQLLGWLDGEPLNYLLAMYFWNLIVTLTDLALVLVFSRKIIRPSSIGTTHLAQSV